MESFWLLLGQDLCHYCILRGISTESTSEKIDTWVYGIVNGRDLDATRALRWLSGNLYFIRQCERALSSGSLASEMLLSVQPGWEIIFFCDGNLSTWLGFLVPSAVPNWNLLWRS